ncbi:MAG: SDR family NAD(P)-dependent oxidoreductase [Deltaproteobacteria bacterium]
MTARSFRERYGGWALIAGASEGLGAEFAEQLARRRLSLVLVARRTGPLESLAETLRARHGVEVRALSLDLSDPSQIERLAAETAGLEVGLVVCNAALAPIGEFLARSTEEHGRLIDLNCRATALLAHRYGTAMCARGRGGLVVMTSLAALQGTALTAHYAASKAYLRVLAEGLWEEWRPRGVDVVACMAGPTETPTWSAGQARRWLGIPPVQRAEDVVDTALASLGHGPVCVPGAINRLTGFLMQRVLTTAGAVRAVSGATRRMYRRG